MEKNEGTLDRVLRIVIGIALLGVWAGMNVPYETVLLIVGLVALVTGLTGFCALYKVLNVSTCKEC